MRLLPSDWMRTVRGWHGGQLVVLWVGGFFAAVVLFFIGAMIADFNGPPVLVGLVLLPLFAIPFALLALTWVWFGGRSGNRQ